MTLSITDTQHNIALHHVQCHDADCHDADCHDADCHDAESHDAECHYAECCSAKNQLLACYGMLIPGSTKGGSITVPLTSCLTGLESAE
jgi:hypothetical protein